MISSSNARVSIPDELADKVFTPHRLAAYMFIFIAKGAATHFIDLKEIVLEGGRLLFVLPHQIHQIRSGVENDGDWYKLAFDQDCLSLLPQSFDFLLNPLNNAVIHLTGPDQTRVKGSFQAVEQILMNKNQDTAPLLLAHLHALLTELNYCYFRDLKITKGEHARLSEFLHFRKIIERDFKLQPAIHSIVKELSTSENKLYGIVKEFSGVSPKEFLMQRIILEAQRILFYESSSSKEVAFELGFSDPDYFSRLFKKSTGKRVSQFLMELKDLSGKKMD